MILLPSKAILYWVSIYSSFFYFSSYHAIFNQNFPIFVLSNISSFNTTLRFATSRNRQRSLNDETNKVESSNRMHVTLFSGREIPPIVVIRSLFEKSSTPELITVHMIFDNISNIPLIDKEVAGGKNLQRDIRLYELSKIEQELIADGIEIAWLNDIWAQSISSNTASKRWSVYPAVWDNDYKHVTPLNHLRFYIPYFRFLKGVDRVLFLDDDVVINKDIKYAFQHPFSENKALLGSCLIPSYNPQCEHFDIKLEQYTYAQTPFFGFPNHNIYSKDVSSIFCSDPLSIDNKQHGCIKKAGYEILLEEAKRINGQELNLEHKAWNFGYIMIDLNKWTELKLTQKFNRWMESNFRHSLMPPWSIGFGLGVPYLALEGSVQCYDNKHIIAMEGFGFMYPEEFLSSNISLAEITTGSYLHYTGGKKPWANNAIQPFNKYWTSYWPDSQSAAPINQQKQLVVLISSHFEGSEWAMFAMDHQDDICATGAVNNHFRPFPLDLLGPHHNAGKHKDQFYTCNFRTLCSWRQFLTFFRYPASNDHHHQYQALLENWLEWYELHRNQTELFKAYIRVITNDADFTAKHPSLILPCRCAHKSKFVVMRLFLEWIVMSKHDNVVDTEKIIYSIGSSSSLNLSSHEERIDILRVFQDLNAKFIIWRRENTKDVFQAVVQSHKSVSHHCKDESCIHNQDLLASFHVDHSVPLDENQWQEFDSYVYERRQVLTNKVSDMGIKPLSIDFEICRRSPKDCSSSILTYLGFSNTTKNIFDSTNLHKIGSAKW